jgi:ABC-type transport system involved in multi-copper enzyme maturation permease subunit
VRRPWLGATALLGILLAGAAGAVAATHGGAVRVDSLHASATALLLIGGLVLALGLGATMVNRDAEAGFLGLLAAAGARREPIVLARIAARLALLVGVLAVWTLALEAASAALGMGLDGPLAVHALATAETMALVLLAAAAVGAGFGPTLAAVVGVLVLISAQSVVNLQAASDQFLLGNEARPAVGIAYHLLPRAITSPMLADLQNRGQGGAAGPQLEINQTVVQLSASTALTVLWTLLWCAAFGALAVLAFRRRAL